MRLYIQISLDQFADFNVSRVEKVLYVVRICRRHLPAYLSICSTNTWLFLLHSFYCGGSNPNWTASAWSKRRSDEESLSKLLYHI